MADGVQQQQRRGTESAWVTSGKILAAGEIGYATDSKIIKIGDGVNEWDDLVIPYDGRYLPIGGTATNAETLDGISSGGFLLVGDASTPATADKVVKRDASGRAKAAAGASTDDVVNFSQLTTASTTMNISRTVTAAFTLALTDVGKLIVVNNGSFTGFALNVPTNAAVAVPIGSYVDIVVSDKGPITITPASGVTVTGPLVIYGQHSQCRLVKTGTNTWIVVNVSYGPGPVLRRKIKVGADNTLTTSTFTKLRLDGADSGTALYTNNFDSLGANQQWSAAELTKAYCRRSGFYDIRGQMTLNQAQTGRMYLRLLINGIEQNLGDGRFRGSMTDVAVAFSTHIAMSVGDFVELEGFHEGGANSTVNETSNSHSVLEWAWCRPLV